MMNWHLILLLLHVLALVHFAEARCWLKHCKECTHDRCTECEYGWYGNTCSDECIGCWVDGCEQYSGRCVQCSPGYYTENCDIPCPVNCRGTFKGDRYCHRTTGQCLEGCEPSFWGTTCEEKCSKNCLKSYCEQRDGTCYHGCNDGFYGRSCNHTCSPTCINKCSYINGYCDNCKQGFRGLTCDVYVSCDNCLNEECSYNDLDESVRCLNGCKDGWTFADCSQNCSDKCKDHVCHVNGTCLHCQDGYTGEKCEEEKTNESEKPGRGDTSGDDDKQTAVASQAVTAMMESYIISLMLFISTTVHVHTVSG